MPAALFITRTILNSLKEGEAIFLHQLLFHKLNLESWEYFSSAKLEDEACVDSKISEIGKVSIEFVQEIKVLERLCVKAFVKIACVKLVDGIFKPIAIPLEIFEQIKLLQK